MKYLFIISIIALCLEVITPGFGALGFLGLLLLFASVIMLANSVVEAVMTFIVIFAILGMFYFFMKIVFQEKSAFVLNKSEKPEEGYIAPRIDKGLVGEIGVAETDLHPIGRVKIKEDIVDVVSKGEYIHKGERVVVSDVDSSRIVVKKYEV